MAAGARAVAALDVHGSTPVAARGLQELTELSIGGNKMGIGHSYLQKSTMKDLTATNSQAIAGNMDRKNSGFSYHRFCAGDTSKAE